VKAVIHEAFGDVFDGKFAFVDRDVVTSDAVVLKDRIDVPLEIDGASERDGSRSERGLALEAACRNAGFEASLLDDIDADIWEKFILLAALSGMTTLTRLPNGPLRETPATRALVEACMTETAAVGRARGVALSDDVVASVMALWDGLPAEMVASMSHDLNAGKPLELDHLSGAVARLGQSLGVPTPTHAFIHAALQPYVNGTPPK